MIEYEKKCDGVILLRRVLTTCGYCGCGCGLYVNIENNEILGVTPQAGHVVSNGKLCAKGWHGFGFVNSPKRLTKPLIKNPDGSFREVTWEEAYKAVKIGFENAMTGGDNTDSIGVFSSARCTNEENFLITKLARLSLKTSSLDHCARL